LEVQEESVYALNLEKEKGFLEKHKGRQTEILHQAALKPPDGPSYKAADGVQLRRDFSFRI